MDLNNEDFRRVKNQNNNSEQLTQETFKALVDAIIPRTPELAEEYGEIQYYGALDLYTDEYMVWSLNNYYIPLAKPMAQLLNLAAEQLEINDGNERKTLFAELEPYDRFRALVLLEELKLYFPDMLIPMQNYPGLLSVTNDLVRLTMLGYYSEWSGYGSTRLETPNERILEYYPVSWEQVGYPGPSFSYRALVTEYYKTRKVNL
ncbi:MAG: hypothetical protein K0R15_1892 [Clostridiales bacterium]|jgi:hypothetical protein|nr:hypothetical protein [Clostridiales bacterium]